MAEKITERKEYRGLGYAPSISVPGLIQTRPVAATRPPQTNELTKLAKSLGDFGETFANAQLRKAAIADDEAKQLATEALSSIAMGGWVRDEKGKPVPKFDGGDYGASGKDVRSLAFQGTDEDLSTVYAELGIPKEATPAFYAYLRRGMAESVAYEFSNRLTARIKEAGRLGSVDGDVNNSQLIREISQEESGKIREQFGDNWFLYAPEAVRKAEQQFTIEAQAQLLKNRGEEADAVFKQTFSRVLANSDDFENFNENLAAHVTQARGRGLKVRELSAEATISTVDSLLRKGHVAAARELVEKLDVRLFTGPVPAPQQPQDVASITQGITDKMLEGVASRSNFEAGAGKLLELESDSAELKTQIKSLEEEVAKGGTDRAAKQAAVQLKLFKNRLAYLESTPTTKRNTIPLLDEGTEKELGAMIERAEHNNRVHRTADRSRIEEVIKNRINAYRENNPQQTTEQAQAALQQILSQEVDLDRMDADGNPISISPMVFDKTLFNTNTWKSKLRAMEATDAAGRLRAEQTMKRIAELADRGDSESVEKLREHYDAFRSTLSESQTSRANAILKQAESLVEIEKTDRWSVETKQGLSAVETEVLGISTVAGLRDSTPAQEAALPNKNAEFLTKFRQRARANYRLYLEERPEGATEEDKQNAMDKAISNARASVIEEMKKEFEPVLVKDDFADYRKAWNSTTSEGEALADGAPGWMRKGLGLDKDPTQLKRRLVANESASLIALSRVPRGNGTIYSRISSLPAYRRNAVIASFQKIQLENRALKTLALGDRKKAARILNAGEWEIEALGVGVSGTRKLSDTDIDRLTDDLRNALVITGVTPKEVISGTLNEGVQLEEKTFEGRKSLFNPMLTPMFESSEQLLKMNKNDEETIKQMAAKLKVDPKFLVAAQLRLLRTRGMLQSPKKK